jgi:hypothetical protein
MIYRLIGGKTRQKFDLSSDVLEIKRTVVGRKMVCVREEITKQFYAFAHSAGVCHNPCFFRLLAKKEGHGVHRESLGFPAPLKKLFLRNAKTNAVAIDDRML